MASDDHGFYTTKLSYNSLLVSQFITCKLSIILFLFLKKTMKKRKLSESFLLE